MSCYCHPFTKTWKWTLIHKSLILLMKSVYKLCNIMCFSPGALLSSVSKERCIANLNELPQFIKSGNAKHSASVLVPICVQNEEVCLLYTLRSSNLNSHSGQVSFPGGKIDKNETAYDAALRETREEIGVPAEDIDIWTKMCQVQGRDQNMVITPVVGQIKDFDMSKLQANPDEVADIFTVPMRVLSDNNNHACLVYNNIVIPVYTGGKHKVWGITGMITHLFLQSFLPSNAYTTDFTRKEYLFSELMPAKL